MMSSPPRWWGGPLDAEQLARTAVHRVRDAAAELVAARGLRTEVATTDALIAASFAAIDHLRVDGRSPQPWGEFSGFVEARDGWVRLHANYPHHAAVLRTVLGVEDRPGLEREISRRDAAEVEDRVSAAGGIAVAVRTPEQWREHPHAIATAQDSWSQVQDRGERPMPGSGARQGGQPPNGPATLAGVRVLDLTRVIAGPTCTQVLACLGADVLRIDPPHRPELLDQHLSTGMGKRSAVADLRRQEIAEQLRALAAGADVILDGYRPGALARHGLGLEELEQLAPQAVIASLSAWGEHGPWGERAGFDSIVQAATGIAVRCGEEGRPGALAVQALDHSTGHLLAAHILEALALGRAVTVRASLLGAARTLLDLPTPTGEVIEPGVARVQVRAGACRIEAVPPPLLLDGRTLERDVGPDGAARAQWMA